MSLEIPAGTIKRWYAGKYEHLFILVVSLYLEIVLKSAENQRYNEAQEVK